MKFVNLGFGNLVALERVVSIAAPDAAPIKRLVQDAKDSGRSVDLCCGKKCRTVLILDSGHVVLSALSVESVGARLMGQDDTEGEDEF